MIVDDSQLAALWCRAWTPSAPALLTAPCGWAEWDGKTATFGRHASAPAPDAAALAVCPAFVADWHRLREPAPADLAARGVAALAAWAAAGFPITSQSALEGRQRACQGCELWDNTARGGLGTCRHGRCACTRLKTWLQTERCPAGRWPE